jgi:hypothetical protein
MALAEYFHRSAVAASQVVAGFDEDAIRRRLCDVTVGISLGESPTTEGLALADLAVRLLARLYPAVILGGRAGELADLAGQINPNIEIGTSRPDVLIAIGDDAPADATRVIYAGSDGWVARLSSTAPVSAGDSSNPFGAGTAACLAVANVFRAVFLDGESQLDGDTQLSALDFVTGSEAKPGIVDLDDLDVGEAVLVGAGAIGHGALWAFKRLPCRGQLHVVDHEPIELSNLQRYVLATRKDEHRLKTELAEGHAGTIEIVGHPTHWENFCAETGYHWERVLVALDSARGRRAVQASLPMWIANAWTQPGDLGVSTHPWTETGACLSCLYLPQRASDGEDSIIAQALGLVDMQMEVRRLLHTGQPVPRALLATIEEQLELPAGAADAFNGRTLRELYVEGVCGGALVSLDQMGRPRQDVHVPIAHQSALAGVLLAGRLVAERLGVTPNQTSVARINVMHPVGEELAQPMQKDPRGICICQDPVYRAAYDGKWR